MQALLSILLGFVLVLLIARWEVTVYERNAKYTISSVQCPMMKERQQQRGVKCLETITRRGELRNLFSMLGPMAHPSSPAKVLGLRRASIIHLTNPQNSVIMLATGAYKKGV